MSTSDISVGGAGAPTVKLPVTVAASDDAAEVFLVDSDFRVLVRGIGRATVSVPPGIYRAKARIGELQNEELFVLDAADAAGKLVAVKAPEFASPIPLAQTSTTHEYHQGAAQAAASEPGRILKLGTGAKLALFFRDPADIVRGLDGDALRTYSENYRGLRLRDWRGRLNQRLVEVGTFEPRLGYLLVEADVDPGAYFIAAEVPGRPDRCVGLIASPHWATQLYVNLDQASEPLARRIDLDDAAIVLDRPGAAFAPWRHDLRVLEVARKALEGGNNVMAGPVMDELLGGKFENPMMGLIAAHLLLLDRAPDLALVDTIIANTGQLIGNDHPDLVALQWRAASCRGSGKVLADLANPLLEKVQLPPMLRLSWDYLIAAVNASTNPAVARRMPFTLAGNVLSSPVWLTWEDVPTEDSRVAGQDTVDRAIGASVPGPSIGRVVLRTDLPSDAARIRLDRVFESVLETGATLQRAWNWVTRSRLLRKVLRSVLPEPGELDLHTYAGIAFQYLMQRYDWDAIVRLIKQGAGGDLQLTPFQRSLLVTLQAAQEQWRQEGELPVSFIADWIAAQKVTFATIAADLKALDRLARSSTESARTHADKAGTPVGS